MLTREIVADLLKDEIPARAASLQREDIPLLMRIT